MACPHLREVVMLFCDACPVKKMLPLDRLATAEPCLGDFAQCPFFASGAPSPDTPRAPGVSALFTREAPHGGRT
jgi:hypothetical protein